MCADPGAREMCSGLFAPLRSLAAGVAQSASVCSVGDPSRALAGPSAPVALLARGVAQSSRAAAWSALRPSELPAALRPSLAGVIDVGVAHAGPAPRDDVDASSQMAAARFSRREQSRRNAVAQSSQVMEYVTEAEADMACDVLEQDPLGADLSDDARDIGPEVALVGGSPPLSGDREWLARISGEHDIAAPPPESPVERAHVVPHRGGREISGALACHDDLLAVRVALDPAGGVEFGLGEHEGHVQSAAAGAEAESVPGPGGM